MTKEYKNPARTTMHTTRKNGHIVTARPRIPTKMAEKLEEELGFELEGSIPCKIELKGKSVIITPLSEDF